MTDISRRTGNHMVPGQGTTGYLRLEQLWYVKKIYTDQRILYGYMSAVRKTAGENSFSTFLYTSTVYLRTEPSVKRLNLRLICYLNLQENMFK
jgi:hypothetical protein